MTRQWRWGTFDEHAQISSGGGDYGPVLGEGRGKASFRLVYGEGWREWGMFNRDSP